MDIAIALGGGGARGFAHVGVLRRLEKEGFRIRAVAGTSAGGIVASAYAAGYTPDEIEAIFEKIDQSKLFAHGSGDGPGVLGLSGAMKVLEEFLGDRTFTDLKIPCAMAAVDLNSAREVSLSEGRVVDAVLATIAIPGVFPPKNLGNYRLVDGGVLDPVPVSLARLLAPHLPVIAVILSPRMEPPGRFSTFNLPVKIPAQIVERLTRTRVAQAFSIFMESIDISDRMLTELRLEIDKPDLIIRPDVRGIGLLDKVDIHHVVSLGEQAVDAIIPDLRRSVSWTSRLRRSMFPASGKTPRRGKVTPDGKK